MFPQARVEAVLGAVARRHAPALVPANLTAHGMDAADLARRLAAEGVFVVGLHAADPAAVSGWVEGLTGLHRQVCAALFPSFQEVNAAYADSAPPPIVVVTAVCAPAIAALGACVVPFAAAHAGARPAAEAVYAVCDRLLALLEAGDLTADAYAALRALMADGLMRLLTLPARPFAIAPADPALAALLTPPPAPPPPGLPETPRPPATLPTSVPVFFDPRRADDDSPTPPPVPPLPPRLPH
jgi:hypothetical protein